MAKKCFLFISFGLGLILLSLKICKRSIAILFNKFSVWEIGFLILIPYIVLTVIGIS